MPREEDLTDDAARKMIKALLLDGIFPDFTAAEAAQFFPASGVYSYVKDDYVIRQGEESRDLFVVIAGTVAITQTFGTAAGQLATLGPGQLFGEIALVAQGVRIASAVAGEGAVVYRLVQADIERVMKSNPVVAEHLRDLARKRLES